MWPGMGIVGFGMIVALLSIFSVIPGYIHAVLLLIFFASAGYFFWSTFSTVRGPGWAEGARRVERDSDLPNRPITEGTDVVAAGKGDPFAEKLWRSHIIRLLASAQRLTLKLPKPNMASRDPRGLRFAVLIGVVLGFVVAGPRSGERLVSGLLPVFADAIDNSVFVAWVAPPSYTQLPPRSLTDSTVMNKDDVIPAPINSTLVMRLRGTSNRARNRRASRPQGRTADLHQRRCRASKRRSTSTRLRASPCGWDRAAMATGASRSFPTSRRPARSRKSLRPRPTLR